MSTQGQKQEQQQRLRRQMEFLLEADKEKFITRQTYLSDAKRKENDAEHAWHLALMAWVLSEHANEKIDLLRTILMVLIHDLVEIDAGDTFAYDEEGKKTQRQREEAAADRLFALLPGDQGAALRALWEEFEAAATPEAAFAHAMDNLQPTMLNAATGGIAWAEHRTTLSDCLRRHEGTRAGSAVLYDFCKETYLKPFVASGQLAGDPNDL